MGALTEVEIFDCLTTNLKLAAELCDDLARIPLRGATYRKYCATLKLIEGACKQASTWREDTRWLPIGRMMAECHQRAGDWLRGFKMPDGTRVKIAEGTLHPCFEKLASTLRGLILVVEKTRHERTNRSGMILPETARAPHRDTRPVGFRRPDHVSPGGIILPASAA